MSNLAQWDGTPVEWDGQQVVWGDEEPVDPPEVPAPTNLGVQNVTADSARGTWDWSA